MSFRTRLTSFFVMIVVLPMLGVGLLVFRLIGQSQQGKADARANGLATAAASLYGSASATARADAATIASNISSLHGAALGARAVTLASRAGLARLTVTQGSRTLAAFGSPDAIAPGTASVVSPGGGPRLTLIVSELTAPAYARDLLASGVAVVVRQGGRTLASTLPAADSIPLPRTGTVHVDGVGYRAVTNSFPGFAGPVTVGVLSALSATSASLSASWPLAAAFIAGFMLLAFSFSVLASRQLQDQLSRFLLAARRLGSGDFSSPIKTEGRDEFAALGQEFNRMSEQLAHRIDELAQERARLRESVRRIGETFAANLDRPALLELALQTAVDAVDARCGRLSARSTADESLSESGRIGSLDGLEEPVLAAERAALRNGGLAEAAAGETHVAATVLGPLEQQGRAYGVITVARSGRPFSSDDRDLLRSLATQATLALENVDLHFQVRRQAVTDELTGLANHGRFQELLSAEIDQVRRYHHPVGLIMLDIDDFKSINDRYGHQQGDIVLRQVARVVRDSSRDADVPARYGGEEMAVILPHTDLDGAHTIADRVRASIEALRVPRLDQNGQLRITASVGVAATNEGDKDALIANADAALYTAKRQGKNRTVRAPSQTADAVGAE